MMLSLKRVIFVYFLGILLYWYPAYLLGWAGEGIGEFSEIPLTYRVIRLLWVLFFGCFFFIVTIIRGVERKSLKSCDSFIFLLISYIYLNIFALFAHYGTFYELMIEINSSFLWITLIFIYLSLKNSFSQFIDKEFYSTLQCFIIIQLTAAVYHIFGGPVASHDSGILKRGIGTLGEPSAFGIFSTFAAIMYFSKLISHKEKIAIKLFFAFSVILLLLSISISAIIGFIFGIIYLLIYYGKFKKKIVFVILTIFVSLFISLFFNVLNENLFFVKYLSVKISSNIEGSSPPRLEIVDSVNYFLNEMSLKDFLIGDFTGHAPEPENYYIFILFKKGIIIFALLMVIIFLSIRRGHSKAIRARNNNEYKKCAFYSGLTGFIIAITISNMAIPSLRIFVGSIIIWNAVLLIWFTNKFETNMRIE